MKLKSLLCCLVFVFSMSLQAADRHVHSTGTQDTERQMAPGYCQVEIINNSYDIMKVYGTFDDGSGIIFDIYPYEAPHYVSLYYYGYCHRNIYLEIWGPNYLAFGGYLPVDHTVTIYANYQKKKAMVSAIA